MENLTINVEISLPESINEESVNKAVIEAKQAVENRIREEINAMLRQPIWEEIADITGYYIDENSNIIELKGKNPTTRKNQNIFTDETHAKSSLAMAKISQLMPYYGGMITDKEWLDTTKIKYVVIRDECHLAMRSAYSYYKFIAFRTHEDRERFLSREENVQLIKDYFMID